MLKIVTNFDELLKAFMVRAIVFIEEQHVPYNIEVDEFEHSALHIVGEMEDGEPYACGRIRFLGEYAKLERIAVRKDFRRRNLGHELVDFMMDVAREKGFHKFKMHAQAHLTGFYGKHGFRAVGEIFKEADIDHYLMVKDD